MLDDGNWNGFPIGFDFYFLGSSQIEIENRQYPRPTVWAEKISQNIST